MLLPAEVLLRRADSVVVVGEALQAKASGLGARPIAAMLHRPLTTVKGWLRRFAAKAGVLREWFVRLLVAVAVDPQIPDAAATPFADAVTAIMAVAAAIGDRFAVVMVTPWRAACVICQGGLLSPYPPAEWINTSSSWQRAM